MMAAMPQSRQLCSFDELLPLSSCFYIDFKQASTRMQGKSEPRNQMAFAVIGSDRCIAAFRISIISIRGLSR
jgi:hypothetical protein